MKSRRAVAWALAKGWHIQRVPGGWRARHLSGVWAGPRSLRTAHRVGRFFTRLVEISTFCS